MYVYSVCFFLALVLLTYKWKAIQIKELKPWVMPTAFAIKVAAGLILFLVHIQTYGVDELSHDGETFFKEGKYLNDLFYQSPRVYFSFLTGIGESEQLVQKYLYMTEYWSGNTLTLTNDSKNVIRVHSILHFFSMNSYYVHLSALCLLSLIGVRNLFLSFKQYVHLKHHHLFWILLLVPSTIFWTSSLMKEPMLFFGMSLLVRSIFVRDKRITRLIFFILALFLLIGFKPYVLICILVALMCVAIYRYIFSYRLAPTLLTLAVMFVIFAAFMKGPKDQIVHFLTRKQFDFVNVGKGGIHAYGDTCFYYFQPGQYDAVKMDGNRLQVIKPVDSYIIEFGTTKKPVSIHLEPSNDTLIVTYFANGCLSFIETTPINDSFLQLMKNIPEALVNSFLRPFPSDPGSNLKFFSMLEVWLIITFLIFALIKHRKLENREKSVVFGLFIFALLLLLLIGWTTPVIGAITRYRFPAQLALIILGLIIIKPPKLLRR